MLTRLLGLDVASQQLLRSPLDVAGRICVRADSIRSSGAVSSEYFLQLNQFDADSTTNPRPLDLAFLNGGLQPCEP